MPTISMFYGILEGQIPSRQLRIVQVWMDLHYEDLMLDLGVGCCRRTSL